MLARTVVQERDGAFSAGLAARPWRCLDCSRAWWIKRIVFVLRQGKDFSIDYARSLLNVEVAVACKRQPRNAERIRVGQTSEATAKTAVLELLTSKFVIYLGELMTPLVKTCATGHLCAQRAGQRNPMK